MCTQMYFSFEPFYQFLFSLITIFLVLLFHFQSVCLYHRSLSLVCGTKKWLKFTKSKERERERIFGRSRRGSIGYGVLCDKIKERQC